MGQEWKVRHGGLLIGNMLQYFLQEQKYIKYKICSNLMYQQSHIVQVNVICSFAIKQQAKLHYYQ